MDPAPSVKLGESFIRALDVGCSRWLRQGSLLRGQHGSVRGLDPELMKADSPGQIRGFGPIWGEKNGCIFGVTWLFFFKNIEGSEKPRHIGEPLWQKPGSPFRGVAG